MVAPDMESPWGADEREITRSIVRDCIWLVMGVAFLVLAVGGLREEAISYAIFAFFLALVLVVLVAHWVNQTHTELAALLLSVGSMTILVAGVRIFSAVLLAPWLLVGVLLICSVLGWQAGIASGVIGTALLTIDVIQHAAPPFTPFDAASLAAAMWGCVVLYWLISRPTRAALGWAMNSYQKALRETERARERQAELVRLSKTLSESNYRLQQLNIELERARQQAQEASRLKTQFATAVSHELRTPLNLIIGFCEMMVLAPESAYGEALPPSYQRDLEVVYRNAYHISALVDDILDLSQIEADRMALQRDWHSISAIVREAVHVVESLFHTRSLWLRVELPSDLPLIFADKTRIRQILINLLSNAARLTDQGGATVRVEKESERLLVHVEDTGPGIPYDDLQRVFEEFQQSRLPGGRRGGTGLGLTVSKRFAELHGGTLWVHSVLGQGTTFTLALPLTREAIHDERGEYFGRADRAPGRRSEPAVLVLDPSKYLHRVFRRYLDGYRVLHASTVASMRQQLKRRPVQAIVIVNAEGKDHMSVPFKEVLADHANLPVVRCCFSQIHGRFSQQATEIPVLLKPVTRESLFSALRKVAPQPARCLIVDDEGEMRTLLERMVRSFTPKCQVFFGENGEDALRHIQLDLPDVVLLDIRLGDISGIDVLQNIRQGKTMPAVILITGFDQEDEVIRVTEVSISRGDALPVGVAMRWLSAGLDAVLGRRSSAAGDVPAPVG